MKTNKTIIKIFFVFLLSLLRNIDNIYAQSNNNSKCQIILEGKFYGKKIKIWVDDTLVFAEHVRNNNYNIITVAKVVELKAPPNKVKIAIGVKKIKISWNKDKKYLYVRNRLFRLIYKFSDFKRQYR